MGMGVRVINPVRPHAIKLINGEPFPIGTGPNPPPLLGAEELELDHSAWLGLGIVFVRRINAVASWPMRVSERSGVRTEKLGVRKLTGGDEGSRARRSSVRKLGAK